MELKDLILETLNELSQPNENTSDTYAHTQNTTIQSVTSMPPPQTAYKQGEALREECEFLEMLQERLLVLFEGLNAPQNKDTQTRLNITINFLEYELSVIAERLNDIKR